MKKIYELVICLSYGFLLGFTMMSSIVIIIHHLPEKINIIMEKLLYFAVIIIIPIIYRKTYKKLL